VVKNTLYCGINEARFMLIIFTKKSKEKMWK